VEVLVTMIPQNDPKWEFPSVHLGVEGSTAHGRTIEDLYRAFLRWSRKPKDTEVINVSKAFRRLESFADFGLKYHDQYFKTPYMFTDLPIDSFCQVWDWTSREGAVVWYADVDPGVVTKAVALHEEIGDQDYNKKMIQEFWHLCLSSCFDHLSQDVGIIFVQYMNGLGLRGMMTLRSIFKTSEDVMNEMFYACMPIRIAEVHVVGAAWWINAIMAFARLFMSKKMSKRMVSSSRTKLLDAIGGRDLLPEGGWMDGTHAVTPGRYSRFRLSYE